MIVEASQSGAIVVGDKGVEIGVALGVAEEASVVRCAILGHTGEMVTEAAVEAFDHAVGLRAEGFGELVADGVPPAELIKGMLAGGLIGWLVLFVDGKAVGELGPVVGQDGVDLQGKAGEEAFEEAGGGLASAIGEDFEIDKAGGAIDGDVGKGALATTS